MEDGYRIWHHSARSKRWICLAGGRFSSLEAAERVAAELRTGSLLRGSALLQVRVLPTGEEPWMVISGPRSRPSALAERHLVESFAI